MELIEKVKRGLKHCSDRGKCNDCCPYSYLIRDDNEGMDSCTSALCTDALSVIEQMEQEIERLKKTEAEKQAERKRKRQEYMKKYRSEHKQQANQYNREWRKKNPEKWKAQKAREKERQKRKNAE